MKLNDYVCFKPPTIYDLLMTFLLIAMLWVSFFIQKSQAQMQKDYVTKEYIYNFYITKDQFQIIESERPKYMERIKKGESIESVTFDYNKFVDRIMSLRVRGLEK